MRVRALEGDRLWAYSPVVGGIACHGQRWEVKAEAGIGPTPKW